MTRSEELEFKFRVDGEHAFEALAERLGCAPLSDHDAVTQVNHFFDTAELSLRKAGFVLRLREEGGTWRVTAKGGEHGAADGVLTRRIEEEIELAPPAAEEFLARAGECLDLIAGTPVAGVVRPFVGDAALQHVGSFQNVRTKLPPVSVDSSEELVFELDRTSFPGGRTDYEIEVEIESEGQTEAIRRALYSLLEEARIAWSTAPSKAARFFQILEEG